MSILSQIIAYAPNKIDTEVKARAMVGEPTDEQTQFGKPIYQTPEGEKVSEKSITLFFNGDWMNVPSIQGGKAFNEDELRLMIKQGKIQPTSVHKSKDEAEAAAKARSDSMIQEPRYMYARGQLVQPSADGSRPGYAGKMKWTTKEVQEIYKDLPENIFVQKRILPSGKTDYTYRAKIRYKGKVYNFPSKVATPENKKQLIKDVEAKWDKLAPNRISREEYTKLRLLPENRRLSGDEFAEKLNKKYKKVTYRGEKWNNQNVFNYDREAPRSNIRIADDLGFFEKRTVKEAKDIINKYSGGKHFLKNKNLTDAQITTKAAEYVAMEKQAAKEGGKSWPRGRQDKRKVWTNIYNSHKQGGRFELVNKKELADKDGTINWRKGIDEKNPFGPSNANWSKAKFRDKKSGAIFTYDNLESMVNKHGGGYNKAIKAYNDNAILNQKTFGGKTYNDIIREAMIKKDYEVVVGKKVRMDDPGLLKYMGEKKPFYSFTEAHHFKGVKDYPFDTEPSFKLANREQGILQNSYNKAVASGNPERIKKAKQVYIEKMNKLSDDYGGIRYKMDDKKFVGKAGTSESILKRGLEETNLSPKKINNLMLEFAGTITDKCKVGNAEGGRIGFKTGSADCLRIAKEGMDEGLSTGKWKSPDQAKMARNIAETAGKISKTGIGARVMAELFGPVAIASLPVFEVGIAGYDTITSGTPFNEAINKTLLHYALGDKTKADPEKLKQADILKMSDGPEKEMLIGLYSNIGNLNRVMNNYKQKAGLEQDKEQFEIVDMLGYGDEGASATQAQKQIEAINNQILKDRAQGKDYMTLSRAVDDPYARALAESKEGELLAKRDANSLSSRLFGTTNPYYFSSNYSGEVDPKRIEEMKAKNIGMGDSQLYSRDQIVDFLKTVPDIEITDKTVDFLQTKLNADYFRNVLNQPGMLGTQYSKGGIASLNVKK
jgi:hypothetical protein